MVASTDIKFYVHTNSNAPQLDNVQGSMIAVLDACLVNGFGSQAVSSITATGTTATVTFGTAHNVVQGQVIEIAGATQAEYNGQHRVTVDSATTLSFSFNGSGVSPATGTITMSLPPLGFDLAFTGAGKRAYRSSNELLETRPYLRVVDATDPSWTSTYAKYAKVGIVESMTGIDSMAGDQMPYDASNADKNWVGSGSGTSAINGWAKWYYAVLNGILDIGVTQVQTQYDLSTPNAGSRQWFVIGNSDYFYILNSVNPADGQYLIYGFGVIDNPNSSDWFLASDLTYQTALSGYRLYDFNNLAYQLDYANTPTILVFKQSGRLPSDRLFLTCPKFARTRDSLINSGANNYITNAGDANAHPLVSPTVLCLEGSSIRILGHMPSMYWVLRNKPFSDLQLFSSDNVLLLAKSVMAKNNFGQVVFDLGST